MFGISDTQTSTKQLRYETSDQIKKTSFPKKIGILAGFKLADRCRGQNFLFLCPSLPGSGKGNRGYEFIKLGKRRHVKAYKVLGPAFDIYVNSCSLGIY